MERMSIVQIFIVFVLASATGSSLQPSVAPRNDCGHGQDRCGRGLCYSPPHHQGCCEGPGGHAIFDTRESICCGGNLIPKHGGINGCCGGRVIDTTENICCAETNHSRLHWRSGKLEKYQECCGGEPFDDRWHECCEVYYHNQKVWDMKPKHERQNYDCCNYRNGSAKVVNIAHETCPAFCGDVMYNPDEKICCQGRLLNYTGGLTRATAACCNGSLYNVTLQSCCFDSYAVRLRPTEKCCASSSSGKIDSSTHLCCASGPLRNTSASQKCCHDTLYDSNNNKCCGGTIISKGATCCNHQWVPKANEVCCLKGAPVNVSNSQQQCCEGFDDSGRRQAQAYNPRTQSCIEGNVSTKQPCIGGPGKICCQGVQHDSRGGQVQCCAHGINAYFTRNQTCCDGNIFSGSNLTCCGGSVCPYTDICPGTFNRSCGSDCLTNGRTICCGGQVYPFRMGPNRLKCCGRSTYNESTQNCSNGQVVDLPFSRVSPRK